MDKVFNVRNDTIKFVHEYGSIIVEAKTKAPREEPGTEPSKAKTKHKNL